MSDRPSEDWERLVRDLVGVLGEVRATMEQSQVTMRETRDVLRDLSHAREREALAEIQRVALEQRRLDLEAASHDRAGAWWGRAWQAVASCLHTPHADRLLGALVSAAVLGLGYLASRWAPGALAGVP